MSKKIYPLFLPIRCIVFICVFVIGAAVVKKDVDAISNWWSIVATLTNIFTIFLLVMVAKKNKRTYFEIINYQKGKTKVVEVIVISIVVIVVGMSGMYLAGLVCYGVIPYMSPMMIAPIPVPFAVINVVLLPLTVVFAEDGLYLGFGVNHIQNKFLAVAVPAFFFALQHSFIPLILDTRFVIYRFLSFLPLTIILCIYYYKKKNPLPVMIGHATIDLFTVVWILATSVVPGFYETLCGMMK